MITYRSVKGDELEHHEVDENFKYLDEKSSNYEVGHVYRGSVIRIYNGHLYLLSSSVTFPFTATNFATELAAGNWLLIGSSSSYKGELNLTTPVLTNGVGVVGDYYKVVEAGDYDFGAGDIAFKVGDFVFYDGSVYGPYVDNNQLFSTNYLKKTFDKIQTHVGTGTNVVIPLNTTGYRNIYLQGAMTSVAGFSFDDIIAAPETSEFPHDGKEYVLWNKSGHDITLKNEIIANDVSFSFKEGTDLVVPDNECVIFMNDTNVLFERDRSWSAGGVSSSDILISYNNSAQTIISAVERVASLSSFNMLAFVENVTKSGSLITGPFYLLAERIVKTSTAKKLTYRYFPDGSDTTVVLRVYAFKQNHNSSSIYDTRLLLEKNLVVSSLYTIQKYEFLTADFLDANLIDGEFIAISTQKTTSAASLFFYSQNLTILY